jgi:GTPase Era involved in 16S rRNA processing
MPDDKIQELRGKLMGLSEGSRTSQEQAPVTSEILDNYVSGKTSDVVNQFKRFFEVYDNALPYLHLDEDSKAYVEKGRGWITRLEQEDFPVAFLGSFSAGKSTIINAVLGREVLPESTKSTTAFPTILRRGEQDRAFLYYIDEAAKDLLWSHLCTDIGLKIDKNLARQSDENYPEHLERVRTAISEYEKIGTNSKIASKPFTTLEQLFQGWGKEEYKILKKPIQLSDLKDYVEGHNDALFIDRIEVNLENIDIPNDIVLVDLPGLSVDNQRHVQFTKDYIQEKAKAFVVCMKPKSLLEGQEIRFLEETNRANPTILRRSFWVINQWDSLNNQERHEEEGNFDQKVKDYNFVITSERFFKFSARNHLLLTCIANGTLNQTEKLKTHVSSLTKLTTSDANTISPDAARELLLAPEVKPFADFCEALFDYLNGVAKDEFVANAKSELLQVVRDLSKHLKPLYDRNSQNADLSAEIQAVEVNKKLNIFIDTLREKITQFATQIREDGKGDLWQESDTNEVEREIRDRIQRFSREELKDKLQSGFDADVVLSRLPVEVGKRIELTLLLREKLILAIEDFFVQRLSRLLLDLKSVDKDYLPEAVLEMLEDKLGKRDIAMRLNGLADSLFFSYGDEINRIDLSSIKDNQGNTLEERISNALNIYQSELISLTKNLVNDLNKQVRRSVKNHAEYLKKELLLLVDAQKERIITQIAQKVNVSEAIAFEQQKRNVVRNSYVTLINLSNEL